MNSGATRESAQLRMAATGYCAAARAARPALKSLKSHLVFHVPGIAGHQPLQSRRRWNGVRAWPAARVVWRRAQRLQAPPAARFCDSGSSSIGSVMVCPFTPACIRGRRCRGEDYTAACKRGELCFASVEKSANRVYHLLLLVISELGEDGEREHLAGGALALRKGAFAIAERSQTPSADEARGDSRSPTRCRAR